jgi:hypothetical protein
MAVLSFCKALPAVVLACALLWTGPSRALTVENYQKWRLDTRSVAVSRQAVLEIRFLGVFEGLLLANTIAAQRQQQPTFCPPKGAHLSGRALRKLVDAELKQPSLNKGRPYDTKTSVDFVLLVVVAKKWPCAKPKSAQ